MFSLAAAALAALGLAACATGYEMKTYAVSTTVPDPNDPNPDIKKRKRVSVDLTPAEAPEFTKDQAGLDAAIQYYNGRGGLAFVIERFNTQTATDARNLIRGSFNKGPSQETLLFEATARIGSDPALIEKLKQLQNDPIRTRTEILEPLMETIRAEHEAKRMTNVKPAAEGSAEGETEEAAA